MSDPGTAGAGDGPSAVRSAMVRSVSDGRPVQPRSDVKPGSEVSKHKPAQEKPAPLGERDSFRVSEQAVALEAAGLFPRAAESGSVLGDALDKLTSLSSAMTAEVRAM